MAQYIKMKGTYDLLLHKYHTRKNMNIDDVRERESIFHDEWARETDPIKINVDGVGNACTSPETRYIIRELGNLSGKKILEIGCGCGEASVYFAKMGAKVTATDLSEGMIKLVKKVADLHEVLVDTAVCDAAHLPFEGETFDVVYAANVLHHVDMKIAIKEAKRVLKKDGIFVCWDPILYNPAIKVYRRLAEGVRTVDEHPVDFNYLKLLKNEYNSIVHRGFWLFTCLIFVRYYFIDHIDPSQVRYWKYIVDDAENVKKRYERLEKLDKLFLGVFPFLKWWCWNMVVIAKDPK